MSGPRVVLVGPPGAGKSSVGERLAATLGVPFRDTDTDVADATGKSIAEIFVDDGEQAFRDLERQAVATSLVEHEGVLALGGGAVTSPEVRASLVGHTVVFLDVSLSVAVERVGLARDRPLLLGSPRSQLKQLMDRRRPWYEQVAVATVDTSATTVDQVVDDVLDVLEGRSHG
jgi:shikimate kinase